ncbi:MAG: nucleoside kinase [Clostridia bacterium]|nr:nucleoside kinase [Clostridia bacterium]
MNIKFKKEFSQEWEEMNIFEGARIEDIYLKVKEKLPYTVLCARQNNVIEDLNHPVKDGDEIELLDPRNRTAFLIYQYTLSMIYLKAVRDVMGNVKVDLENALNKGLYTEIKSKEPVTQEQLEKIEARMRQLVDMDLPIEKQLVSREEGIKIMEEEGMFDKITLLHEELRVKDVKFYTLDGYREFFYGYMAPSTGYIKVFELKKYRRGVLLRYLDQNHPDRLPKYEDQTHIYEAFGEQERWGKLLGVNYITDLNKKIEEGKAKDLILLSEALHEKRIANIAEDIKKAEKRIILIAGPSSSGKTTFAKRLCVQMRVAGLDPIYMGTDDYFVEREDTPLDENGEKNFEDLEAIDIQLFNKDMNGLLSGEKVDIPTFNFMTGHKEFGKRIISAGPNQPIVIEGIHALNEKLTSEIPKDVKYKIYISPLTQLSIDEHNKVSSTDQRLLRRMVRDNLYRGHDAQSTIRDWPKVRAGEDKNIFPFTNQADTVFNSVHIYEIAILKKYVEPLLKDIKEDEPEYPEAVRILKFLRFIRTIEDDSVIVNNSIIREFIGGSIFVD